MPTLELLAGYVICGFVAIIGLVVVWKIAIGQIDISTLLCEKDGSAGKDGRGMASMSAFSC